MNRVLRIEFYYQMVVSPDDFDLFNYTPIDSPVEMDPVPVPEKQKQISDFDAFLIQNIDKFDEYLKDNKSTSYRALTRKGGALTFEGGMKEEIKKLYDEFPDGTRKFQITKLIQKHPALISANPTILWTRISYYLKLYKE